MADYITNTEELQSIADEIRLKTSGTAALKYPEEFVSAIDSLVPATEWQQVTVTPMTTVQNIAHDEGKAIENIAVYSSNLDGDAATILADTEVNIVAKDNDGNIIGTVETISGTMPNNGSISQTITPSSQVQTIDLAEGHYDASTITINAVVIGDKDAEEYLPSVIPQIIYAGQTLTGNQIIRPVGYNVPTSGNILTGHQVTVYGVTTEGTETTVISVSGSMSDQSTWDSSHSSYALGTGEEIVIPEGYHDGTAVIKGSSSGGNLNNFDYQWLAATTGTDTRNFGVTLSQQSEFYYAEVNISSYSFASARRLSFSGSTTINGVITSMSGIISFLSDDSYRYTISVTNSNGTEYSTANNSAVTSTFYNGTSLYIPSVSPNTVVDVIFCGTI